MTLYEFQGSIRVEANSEDEAVAIIDKMEKAFVDVDCEIYTHEMEEVE